MDGGGSVIVGDGNEAVQGDGNTSSFGSVRQLAEFNGDVSLGDGAALGLGGDVSVDNTDNSTNDSSQRQQRPLHRGLVQHQQRNHRQLRQPRRGLVQRQQQPQRERVQLGRRRTPPRSHTARTATTTSPTRWRSTPDQLDHRDPVTGRCRWRGRPLLPPGDPLIPTGGRCDIPDDRSPPQTYRSSYTRARRRARWPRRCP